MPRLTTLLLLPALALCCAAPADPPASGSSTSTGTSTSTATPTSSTGAGDVTTGEVTAACETISQGCPEGQKCTGVKPGLHEPFTGTACVPDNAGAGGPPGGICINAADGSDTCDATSMCMQFGSGEGACLAFCGGPPDAPTCADLTMVCARVDRTWPIDLCVPRCDPLAYDCPDLNFGASIMVCAPAAAGFGCVLRGNLDGQPIGQPCVDHRDCIAAAHCAPADAVPGCTGPGCCAAYCDLDAPACPLPGQSCLPWYAPDTAPAGLDDVGRCTATP